ncbi:MAG: prenyltransferase/squalene oxidase repeat-containing protein [Planctomycetota bacterium]
MMNIRHSLISAAARSKILLGDKTDDVIAILKSRQQADGGFCGKGKESDLYYTGFALLSLLALEAEFDYSSVIDYLDSFGDGEGLDLAHLGALIRERHLVMDEPYTDSLRQAFVDRVEAFRCDDGAYHHLKAQETGSAYGCFLAAGSYQELEVSIPDAQAMLDCLDKLKTNQGGFYNEEMIPAVSVPATSAAMVVQAVLTDKVQNPDAADWLLSCHIPGSGFKVISIAPVPDLLSTAVALHALAVAGADIGVIRQDSLSFVDSLWNSEIGFCPNTIDPISDTEYMFYGLLALGQLVG